MSKLDDAFKTLYRQRAPQKSPMTREQEVTVDHERRILDLEKQVAELRALLVLERSQVGLTEQETTAIFSDVEGLYEP
ncbi:MAG: hypothetical protein ING71_17395 [Rhodocyclaceae bacterium]|nr:hypothetical protein [Rhodocyclaceae bacterium]